MFQVPLKDFRFLFGLEGRGREAVKEHAELISSFQTKHSYTDFTALGLWFFLLTEILLSLT